MWTCPQCDRTFGRANRPHVCLAGMPVEVWLGERTEGQRRAAEAVLAVARRYRDVVIEAVSVGVLIKRDRTIVELRPKTKWLDMSIVTAATITSDRIARSLEMSAAHVYFIHLTDATDVDAEVRGWLADALRPPVTRARRPRAKPARAARVQSRGRAAPARRRGSGS